MNKKTLAVWILVAQFLTVVWTFVCPKFTIQGEVATLREKTVVDKSTWSQTLGQAKVYGRRTVTSPFRHPEPVYFLSGLTVICMVCLALYLLTGDQLDPQRTEEPTDGSAAHGCRPGT